MYEETFAKRLTQLRMAKGVSARDMSLTIGQSAGYINNIENRNNLPSMTVFFYICEYLGITPRDFFDFDVQAPAKLKEMLPLLSQLTDSQLEHIAALIRDFKNVSA